jgi:hypothetical protein
MATSSKRDTLRRRAKPRPRRTPAERAKMGHDMVSRPRTALPALERVLVNFEPQDLKWLNEKVAELKPARRRTSRNELIRLGITIMRNMDPEELRQHLRELD